MMKIQIKGGVALIDEEDASRVNEYRWHTNRDGYAITNIWYEGKRTSISMHRYIMGCVPRDKKEIDHISGNKLDNRKENLRFVEHIHNTWNTSRKKTSNCKYKGVTTTKDKRFASQIMVKGKTIFLGHYKDEVQCAKIYDVASALFHGEFAKFNFPEEPPTEEEKQQLQLWLENPLCSTNKSGYLGVSYHSTRKWWIGAITVKGKSYKLTPCKTAIEAAVARDIKAFELLGDKAKLNFPDRVVNGVYI
jgi:hypothetical protein